MGTWPRAALTLLVCGALSAAVAVPARHYFLEAFGGCALSLGCTGELTAMFLLSTAGLLTPFFIFAAGAFVIIRAPKTGEMSNARRFGIAAAFTLLPPVLLLWYLFS